MMKIFKITTACVLVCATVFGGAFSFVEALAAPANREQDQSIQAPVEITVNGESVTSSDALVVSDSDESETADAREVAETESETISETVSETETETETEFFIELPSETNAFAGDFLIGATDQNAPFFTKILPFIVKNIEENNTHSITPYYSKLKVRDNKTNFQSLGATKYENINGKTVYAEGFYRLTNEAMYDPNCGMGLLIFQAIQYKLKHPEEDVKITYSSYRTSATASVCVVPGSRYYGYMRSLYTTNYDEHGFVRISYMLVEAARLGIEVTMVNQLPSYGVYQYNPATGKTKWKKHIDFKEYFEKALVTDCYNEFAPDKKVSDYLNCVNVAWTVEDQTSNMQHVKSAAVSHYLATDGSEHSGSVYFGSANLDENNYLGANGNNSSQSGVIISDHDELFRITYNYMQLMARYPEQEQMQELRMVVTKMNEEQTALINSGRESEIPRDEQIVYLGSETDPIFELYFTPFGGSPDTWDTTYNPISKYCSYLPESTDYVEFIWNEFGYGKCYLGYTLSKMLERAFCENPNPQNKIAIRVTDFNTDAIQALEKGKEIGYRSINDGYQIHSKDIVFSYAYGGQRHYVSLMTSCNYYMIAFNYRTNSMLVIHETEQTGNGFYKLFTRRYAYGMFK